MLYAALLFALSAQPSLPSPSVTHGDKVAHFLAYGGLAFLCARAARGFGARQGRAVIIGALIAVAYGATDELHQSFVPGRSPELLDLAADAAGAIAGALAWYALTRRKTPKEFEP